MVVRRGNAQTSPAKASDIKGYGWVRRTAFDIDPAVSWNEIACIKSITNLPIVLKGTQTAADAKRAILEGCNATAAESSTPPSIALGPAGNAPPVPGSVWKDGNLR
ncbi:uncharacterized protein PV07_00281 [Cladophialophora immunda]|uniref:FMN-dependent dehydrogenase domain-containing protein n=1 Tax=Cladophialophora immunda TaxID=569365 RepID=A0A0D2DCJ4_9EURO|nr:uncharacterized protein PV07_00281 [Cladophialophora immunda]KIW33429.1 hypothetical protein PV07_00281 [Cladophialophora immunda]